MANNPEGRWVTINGAHVLIKNGQTVQQAMQENFGDKKPLKKRIKEGKHQYSMDGDLYEDMDKDSYNELDAEEENFDETLDSDVTQEGSSFKNKQKLSENEYKKLEEKYINDGAKVFDTTETVDGKENDLHLIYKDDKHIGTYNKTTGEFFSDEDFNEKKDFESGKTVPAKEKGFGWKKTKMASGILYEGPNGERYLSDKEELMSNEKSKKKNFKDTPEWKSMMEEYEASKNGHSFSDLDSIEGWIDRKPWELSREAFDRVANRDLSQLKSNDPNNTWPAKAKAQTDFYNKYKDILTKQIDYDTQRNSDYREFLNSDMFKNYRLEQLLGDKELKKYDMQNSLRKLFNDKYGYDENEKAWFQDFDYDEIDQGKRNGFYSTLDKTSPDWEEEYYKFLDNLPINKKKTLVRLLGNGDLDLDDIINYVKKGR